MVVNLLDPDVIVIGGGLSNMNHLYTELPRRIPAYAFSDVITTPVIETSTAIPQAFAALPGFGPD